MTSLVRAPNARAANGPRPRRARHVRRVRVPFRGDLAS